MPHRFSETYSGFHFCDGEEIRIIIRRHWIVNATSAAGAFFWSIVFPLCIIGGYWGYKNELVFDKNFAVILSGLGTYISAIMIYKLIDWLNHSYDVIIITNDRVIDITQVDFFHRNVIEARLINVQDATGDVKGFLNTLFDWGHIKVRTANDVADFSIEMVEHPHQRAREIFDIARQAQENEMRKNFKMEHKYRNKKKQQKEVTDRRKLFSPAAYRKEINMLLQGNKG